MIFLLVDVGEQLGRVHTHADFLSSPAPDCSDAQLLELKKKIDFKTNMIAIAVKL
jgi:hypothetical protein